jgi:hypothetical protein
MQLHENHSLKWAGVAGLRVRAVGLNDAERTNLKKQAGSRQGEITPHRYAVET